MSLSDDPPAPGAGSPPCVIGPGSCFEGMLAFRGGALVAGRLTGEVCAEGTLWVAESARVRARIDVEALVVAGIVQGEIRARARVELLETARVLGRIETPRVAVAEGALFEGYLDMSPAAGGASARGVSAS